MREYAADHLARRGVRLLHDEYASPGVVSGWWCRAEKACARRRGGVIALPPRPLP
jgi:hypothetical protein